jgi:hypothetical protein
MELFLSSVDVIKGDYITTLSPEINYDPAAIDLPPVISAVFLRAYFGKMWASRKNISDASATPSGIKREWYVCMFMIIEENDRLPFK